MQRNDAEKTLASSPPKRDGAAVLPADGVTGRLVPRSGEGLAEAIEEAVKKSQSSNEIKASSQERAQRLFSVESMVEAHEKLYRELLG